MDSWDRVYIFCLYRDTICFVCTGRGPGTFFVCTGIFFLFVPGARGQVIFLFVSGLGRGGAGAGPGPGPGPGPGRVW
jgi:hypothetical protein